MNRKYPWLAALALALLVSAAHAQSSGSMIDLPSAQDLVTMSIPQRLALFSQMQALPPNQRDANLKTLRTEINGMTPAQKAEMKQHFQTEFDALTPVQQSEVMKQLNDVQPK
jgi:D-mannonate dehydratase